MAGAVHSAFPQGSADWFEERLGRLTASNMPRAMARLKSGEMAKEARDLMWDILAERMTNIPAPHFVNAAMQWGRDNESLAKMRYTKETGRGVIDAGLYHHPEIEYLAASPDGLVGADGLIETKCPTTRTHLQWLEMRECPTDYHWQMLIQLACTRRQWVDFVTFDPRVTAKHMQLRIWRFEPTAERIAEAEQAAAEFLQEVEKMFDRLHTEAA
jgi:putative phage-type endonuclease